MRVVDRGGFLDASTEKQCSLGFSWNDIFDPWKKKKENWAMELDLEGEEKNFQIINL